MSMTYAKAVKQIAVWKFIPDGWEVPLGFDQVVAQAKEALAVLRGMAEENGRLKDWLKYMTDSRNDWAVRAEKAEAELVRTQGNLAQALVDNHAVALETEKNLRKKAEAELDAARPLLEAAMKFHVADCAAIALRDYITEEAEGLARTALAYRASKEGKEKP